MVRKKLARTAIVSKVLQSDEAMAEVGMSVAEVLEAGGNVIDSCLGADQPGVLFKVKGDKRWWVGSIEFCINEANPEYVKDVLEQQAEDADEEGDDDGR